MNLDTVLDILGRSVDIITERIEERREDELNKSSITDNGEDNIIWMIGRPDIKVVLSELQQITLLPEEKSIMAYGGKLYKELYDRLNTDNRRGVKGAIIDILKPFREYSYSMYPETLYQEALNIFGDATNEKCATYFHNPTPEMVENAKSIILEDEQRKAYARRDFFVDHIHDILSKDIVIKTASYLYWYIMEFSTMLDCVLLESGYDLLELQKLHNIKLLDEHKDLLLAKYIGSGSDYGGSDYYVKELLSKVCKGLILPKEIESPRVRKYFTRAIELGYIEQTENNGLKWENNQRGALARLGYFILRVFCPNNIGTVPEQTINKLFGVNRIGSAISQQQNAKKTQKWKSEIDTKIFYD